jgi:hypothetical protein
VVGSVELYVLIRWLGRLGRRNWGLRRGSSGGGLAIGCGEETGRRDGDAPCGLVRLVVERLRAF